MRKFIVAITAALITTVALTGCGNQASTPEEMKEIAEAKQVCEELGGEFYQWWRIWDIAWECDFSDAE